LELDKIYSKNYFSKTKYDDIATLNMENKRRLSILATYLPHELSKVLDFGCAGGSFLSYAKSQYEIWGTDCSNYAVETAKMENPEIADRIKMDLLSSNHQEILFDGIVLWDVLEHLHDPLKSFEDIYSRIKPGGFIFLSTPDIGSLTARLLGKFWAFMTPPEHVSFFSRKSISFLTQRFDAEVLSVKNKGKWVNMGFLVYKIKRIFPKLVPVLLIKMFQLKMTKNWRIYVPTNDIIYVVLKKGT